MGIDDFKDILGVKIPNALNAFHDLEKSIAPQLAILNANRNEIDPELLKHYDSAMKDIAKAKGKLKELKNYGNNGRR